MNPRANAGFELQNDEEPRSETRGLFMGYPGDDLLSHAVTHAVPSALEGLTSVFGMGTGVSPPPLSPGNRIC